MSLNATAVATDSHHVTVLQFCCQFHRGTPKSDSVWYVGSWNCLEGWKLPGCHCSLTGTLLTSLPDLSISTSPNSYPSQWWHSILSDIYVLLYENGSCCWNQPLLSPTASQKRNHPLSLLQILQYFSFCSLDYFTRWKSIEIKDSLLEVGESFVSPKVMRCLPRCDHDSCCFFAHKAVPGQGTKLSINFEPFLVLDQRTT